MNLEKEIINKIGDNKTKEKSFTNVVMVTENVGIKTRALWFYTYRGMVCILDDQGMDVEFSEYDEKSQELIHSEIMSENYK